MTDDTNFSRNCEMEVNLFHALRGHKPVGVNRHFHMVSIYEKLSNTYKKITSRQIWDYLSELFDLSALNVLQSLLLKRVKFSPSSITSNLSKYTESQDLPNESEILPFPNREAEFILPERDFSEIQERPFPRLIVPKQDVEKQDVKTEKHEKTDKQEKLEKHEKSEKHERGSDAGFTRSSKDGRYSTGTPVLNTPDNSPKRKRTRHTPSSTASPATPDAPPPKRRR